MVIVEQILDIRIRSSGEMSVVFNLSVLCVAASFVLFRIRVYTNMCCTNVMYRAMQSLVFPLYEKFPGSRIHTFLLHAPNLLRTEMVIDSELKADIYD